MSPDKCLWFRQFYSYRYNVWNVKVRISYGKKSVRNTTVYAGLKTYFLY